MGSYYASIAKSLERIADALEKMTAPSVDGKRLFEEVKKRMDEEIERRKLSYEKES